jgi:hypothetical protein
VRAAGAGAIAAIAAMEADKFLEELEGTVVPERGK